MNETESHLQAEANVFVTHPLGFKTHFKILGSAKVIVGNMDVLIQGLIAKGYAPDQGPARQPAQNGAERSGASKGKPKSGVRQVQRQRASADAPECEFCGGDVWDNTDTKRGNQPDYKCKDKDCGAAAWIQEDGELRWKEG